MCGETWRGGDRSRKEAADEVRGAETGGQQDPISQRLTVALPPPPPTAPSRAHLLAVTLWSGRGFCAEDTGPTAPQEERIWWETPGWSVAPRLSAAALLQSWLP